MLLSASSNFPLRFPPVGQLMTKHPEANSPATIRTTAAVRMSRAIIVVCGPHRDAALFILARRKNYAESFTAENVDE